MTKAPAPKKQKTIARHGTRGAWVKVLLTTGHTLVRVQWKEQGGKIQTHSRPNTPTNRAELLAFAEGVHERMKAGEVTRPSRLTLQELWDAYQTAEFPSLRPRTRELYTENFRRWALIFGWHSIAEQTTPEMADAFRAELAKPKDKKPHGLSLKTMRNTIDDVKRVFAWAESRELIARNRLRLYRFKVAKEDRPVPPPEYRADDFEKILAALDPASPRQWKPWVALTICGTQGARQNAVLHLAEGDWPADLDAPAPTITWRAAWDKTGKEWTQPLRPRTREAIRVALAWRERLGYTGPWLIPSAKQGRAGQPYTVQSLWSALQDAEVRAGVPKAKGRGAHGLRRMLAGDVTAATGNPMLGLRSIGDKDPRMLERYVQGRDDEMRAAFAAMDAPEDTTKAQRNRNGSNDEGSAPEGTDPATPAREA